MSQRHQSATGQPPANGRGESPVLVLAAGASRRMGRPKALLTAGRQNLLERAISNASCLSRDITVVAGCQYPLVRYRCRRQPAAWVYADHWPEGMAASLRAGIESLRPAVKGVFILLVDQPLIAEDSLMALGRAAAEAPGRPFAADYNGKPGAPAYIPRRLWPDLLALEGDRGASGILARAGAGTLAMPGAQWDVDTPEDWQQVRVQLRAGRNPG